jgi:hypothetical protein
VICVGIELQISELLKQPARRDALEKLYVSRQSLGVCGQQQVNVVNHGFTESQVNPFVCSDASKHLPDLSLNIASEKPLSSPG